MQEKEGKNRIKELKTRSFVQNVYTFTDFLSPSDRYRFGAEEEDGVPCLSYGGAPFAERKMVRYGGESCYGSGEFPIRIVRIYARGAKFAAPLTHRDYLGAILALGIERNSMGDIWANGTEAYLAAEERIAAFIVENLQSVGRVVVCAEVAQEVPPSFAPKTVEERVVVTSLRIDALLARVYDLSREAGQELVSDDRVSASGKPVTKGTYEPKLGEVITARGFGKFTFLGECGTTKKGKTVVTIARFL